jgi:hypothetical protein
MPFLTKEVICELMISLECLPELSVHAVALFESSQVARNGFLESGVVLRCPSVDSINHLEELVVRESDV